MLWWWWRCRWLHDACFSKHTDTFLIQERAGYVLGVVTEHVALFHLSAYVCVFSFVFDVKTIMRTCVCLCLILCGVNTFIYIYVCVSIYYMVGYCLLSYILYMHIHNMPDEVQLSLFFIAKN